MTPDQTAAYIGDYRSFTADIIASGEFKAGEALDQISTATSVRVRDGKTLLTDGPFAETREQLGGFYLVEADNLDRAVEIAAQIPTARHGTIEVRPLKVWDT
jgi:hypothetical protein